MNLHVEGNKVRTTSPYDVRMIRVLPHLEGFKRWGANRSFTFENTAYNLTLWRQTFPKAEVTGEIDPADALQAPTSVFDVGEGRPPFQFKTLPRAHQKAALAKIEAPKPFPSVFGLFMDIGTGKSWVGITRMAQLWCAGAIEGVLLIAKNGVHRQWVTEEIPKHMSEVVPWEFFIWDGLATKKSNAFFDEQFLTFPALKVFTVNIDALRTSNAEKAILRFIKTCRQRVLMIVDESQDIKNASSARTIAAIKFGNLCAARMIMTGTPIAKNLVDAFSQFKFLDDRIFGHKYVTTFRSRYCVLRHNGFGLEIVGHRNVEEFYQKIEPNIYRITSAEALDLPPQVFLKHEFVLSDEQKKLMKSLRQTFSGLLSEDKRVSVMNAIGLATRMQQISCGYVKDESGEIHRLKNPRMDALKNVIDQREGKIIIWCRFHEDIKNVMKELGEGAVDYYGDTPIVERQKNKEAFLNGSSSIRFLVASPEAGGTGLNLQGECQTNIYYSNSFNSLARWQSEGRTWRDGTKGTVTYIDLIARGSLDAKILQNLKDKKSISDLALDEFRKLFELETEDNVVEAFDERN